MSDREADSDFTRRSWPGTPFAPRSAGLNANAMWMLWDRMMVVDVYTDAVEELRAIREGVAMGDMSPLAKYELEGPDAAALADRLIPRDVKKLEVGQVYYTPWCDEHGRVINDGLAIRMGEDRFRFSADPMEGWLHRQSADLDVEISDVTEQIGILTLQGPKAPGVLERASGTQWGDLPFSRLAQAEIDGLEVDVLRQGFTGEIGYELWVDADRGPRLWDAVKAAGEADGIRPAGALALDYARIEAGLLIIGYDYTSASVDRHGATVVPDEAHMGTPFELGMGDLIDFDKSEFIGKDALTRAADGADSGVRLTGIACDWRALQRDCERIGEPTPDLRRVRWHPLELRHDGRAVGRVSSLVWGPSVEALIGFAHAPAEYAEVGVELTLAWPIGAEEVTVPARTRDLPFLPRRRADRVEVVSS